MLEREKDISEFNTGIKDLAVMNLGPMDKLILSRMIERPTALDYIAKIFDGFIEFHGDRKFRDDPGIVGGIARLKDLPVTVIGQQKGRNTSENVRRNFGMSSPDGFRKALRLMEQAEKFRRPVICFVDTPGADPGIGAEERGQGEAIARNLMEMIDLRSPVISIVIGEGGSGGALALSIADEIWMLEHSVFSILSPEGFASILWKDASRVQEAAQLMRITAQELKSFGIIDKILPEPLGGAHQDPDAMAQMIKNSLLQIPFGKMMGQIDEVVGKRYNKHRKIGAYLE